MVLTKNTILSMEIIFQQKFSFLIELLRCYYYYVVVEHTVTNISFCISHFYLKDPCKYGNIAESLNKENEFSDLSEFDIGNIQSGNEIFNFSIINVSVFTFTNFLDATDVNFRSKINVLEDVLIEPPIKLSSQTATSFEDRVMKHLNDLTKAQKSFEERQFSFETRMENKLDAFLNDQSRMQGPSSSTQNQTQWQHKKPVRLNDQSRMLGTSRSSQNENQWQYQEPAHPVHDAIPDLDDFEEFDQNFPIEIFENVAELEYNVRKDLELKFILVILYFHNYVMFSVSIFFNIQEISFE